MGLELNLDFQQAIKIPVHEVKNTPYWGLGQVVCEVNLKVKVNPVSRRNSATGLTSQAFSAQSLSHSFLNKYGGKLASNCRFRPSIKVC